MKFIPTYHGKDIAVDDDIFEELNGFKYYLNNKGYAYRNAKEDGKQKTVYMHREIMNAPKGLVVDHINGNPLDNRKENLRLATRYGNHQNMRKTNSKRTSIYKGVCKAARSEYFQANIRINGKSEYLGFYETEEAAALAYNDAASINFGEFAALNEVPFDPEWRAKRIPDRKNGVGTSKYIGVSWNKRMNKWQCHIMVNYKSICLGNFEDEIEAAQVYNEAALFHRGSKARLNKL